LFFLLFLFFLILSIKGSANILINEIMYDPSISDNYYEWVELYNPTNKSINLSGWSLTDNSEEDNLEGNFENGNGTTIIPPFNYAIITDHGTKLYNNYSVLNNTLKLFVDDSSIGNGLGNRGDKLILKNNLNVTIDAVEWIENYIEISGNPASAIEENNTLSRMTNHDTNDSSKDFYKSISPTPGSKNNITKEGKTILECNESYFLIEKNEEKIIQFKLKNAGRFFDNISIKIINITEEWKMFFNYNKICLEPNETVILNVTINSCKKNCLKNGNIIFIAYSEHKINSSDEITLNFEIINPDLYIKKIEGYNEKGNKTNAFLEGEIIKIKAFLRNQGRQEAPNVVVKFFLDQVKKNNYLGYKKYESVGKYQKYPSIKIDTHGFLPGVHEIIAVVDEINIVNEFNENNNKLSFQIKIIDTTPGIDAKKLLITEIFYHSRPGLFNEFISIYNPTNQLINISGWYLTNEPFKCKNKQNKIIFPNNTKIFEKSKIIISENASSYKFETGKNPDFEYNYDTNSLIPQMISEKKFIMSNKGCAISLKDAYNHTIDCVIYGNKSYNSYFWNGPSIPFSGEGVVLKRNFDKDNIPIDANISKDWENKKKYFIGQSNFLKKEFEINGEITTFVSPDCSFNTIVNEIRNANETIFLNIYEFTDSFLCDELIKALLRDVSVKIYLEGGPIGGISKEEKFILKRLQNYGANIRFIVSDNKKKVFSRYVFNHGKYLIIDNKTVIVESCNWGRTGVPKDPSYGNREWGIIIKNEIVAQYFLNVFFDDWDPERCDSYSFYDMNFSYPSNFYIEDRIFRGTYSPNFSYKKFYGNFTVIPVFSPDNSYSAILDIIDSANDCIYIEQLYIYRDWSDKLNPFVEKLVKKAKQGVKIKVIMNYNPSYESTNKEINQTKIYLESYGINVKFIYTNWSIFTNVHNKGVIVDNNTVLISSINWNENSVTRNREAGIIIKNSEIAHYYSNVFFYDWKLNSPVLHKKEEKIEAIDYKNNIYIVIIFTMTFALIARDWRKRQWT